MAKRRKFTAKFKAEVVLEALTGESSQTARVSLGERVGFRTPHPHPQGGRNSPQRL